LEQLKFERPKLAVFGNVLSFEMFSDFLGLQHVLQPVPETLPESI